jgi:hypothetical protein
MADLMYIEDLHDDLLFIKRELNSAINFYETENFDEVYDPIFEARRKVASLYGVVDKIRLQMMAEQAMEKLRVAREQR